MLNRIFSFVLLISTTQVANAALTISFDPADLTVTATGGPVMQFVDLFIAHDGMGSNLFSEYEVQVTPANSAVSLVSGPITLSDFTFDVGHGVAGNAPGPYLISGGNLGGDKTVSFGGTNLLATIQINVDTSSFSSGVIDLAPVLTNAKRGGFFGTDISSEVTLSPAQVTVSAIPEPSLIGLMSAGASLAILRRRRRNWLTRI